MAKNTNVNIRVDADIKRQAGAILDKMGISFSSAVDIYLHQICIQQALPFDVVSYSHTPKPETLALIERIENRDEKIEGPFSTKEELWGSLGI